MSATYVAAAAARALDAASSELDCAARPLINCLMLVTWPKRQDMIQQAIASFACQSYPHRVLTIVNDGAPCELSGDAFVASKLLGKVVQARAGASIGEKRNLGARAWPGASYIASFDDDDFSLPGRLDAHLAAIGDNVWLSAMRKFISITSLENIIGFEVGRCYGAGMISTSVLEELEWPPLSYCEDHQLYEAVKSHARFARQVVDDDALTYVHRRHESNASAKHRQSLWQGVLPLMIAGAEAMAAPAQVATLLADAQGTYLVSVAEGTHCEPQG